MNNEGERAAIASSERPITIPDIVRDLGALGVKRGMTLFVQSSLSSMGWVCGGPVAVIQALEMVLGPTGTLAMPAMSGDYSDPHAWEHPPVPESWWEVIRSAMPPFDPRYAPTRCMGTIAETFRTWPGTLRSSHPHSSITARGKLAQHITKTHPLAFSLGPGTPLERMVEGGGYALLIGTVRNTTLHLAEALASFPKKTKTTGAPLLRNGRREWVAFEEYDDYTEHFPTILADYMRERECAQGRIGNAQSVLFHQKDLVSYAITWLESHLV